MRWSRQHHSSIWCCFASNPIWKVWIIVFLCISWVCVCVCFFVSLFQWTFFPAGIMLWGGSFSHLSWGQQIHLVVVLSIEDDIFSASTKYRWDYPLILLLPSTFVILSLMNKNWINCPSLTIGWLFDCRCANKGFLWIDLRDGFYCKVF